MRAHARTASPPSPRRSPRASPRSPRGRRPTSDGGRGSSRRRALARPRASGGSDPPPSAAVHREAASTAPGRERAPSRCALLPDVVAAEEGIRPGARPGERVVLDLHRTVEHGFLLAVRLQALTISVATTKEPGRASRSSSVAMLGLSSSVIGERQTDAVRQPSAYDVRATSLYGHGL